MVVTSISTLIVNNRYVVSTSARLKLDLNLALDYVLFLHFTKSHELTHVLHDAKQLKDVCVTLKYIPLCEYNEYIYYSKDTRGNASNMKIMNEKL